MFMKIIEWIKKELFKEYKEDTNNIKFYWFITRVYTLSQIIFYYFYRDTLNENGYIVIGAPTLIVLTLTLIYLIPKHKNPENPIHYIVHPTKFVKIAVLFSFILCSSLFFYAQCEAYSLPINLGCFSRIFSGR